MVHDGPRSRARGYQLLWRFSQRSDGPTRARHRQSSGQQSRCAAALEITIVGPELLFEDAAVLAITGADLSPAVDGHSVPIWTTVAIQAGSRLTFGRRRTGARSYVAVAGALDVALLWGSRSTHISSCTGGFNGRALLADDLLRVSADQRERPYIGAMLAPGNRPLYVDSPTLRVISGPHHANAAQLSVLIATPYQLTSQSNRMGYRLEGQRLHEDPTHRRLSDGTAVGASNSTGWISILLMADRPTTGGYPKIATVISADLPQAAQLQPGDTVTFRTTTLDEAESALMNQWRHINEVPPRSAKAPARVGVSTVGMS